MWSSRRPADLRCISCGYLLRGLAVSTRCPECGTPVKASLPPRRRSGEPQHSMILLYVGAGYLVLNAIASLAPSDVLSTFVVLNPLLLAGAALMAQKVNDPQPFSWSAVGWFLLLLLGTGLASGLVVAMTG